MRILQSLSILVASLTLAGCAWMGGVPPEPAEFPNVDSAEMRLVETGEVCGGIGAFQCANENDFCKMDDGVCVSMTDASGTCTTIRPMCTREYRPVCGCDGATYSNACTAHAEGVSVASKGPCSE